MPGMAGIPWLLPSVPAAAASVRWDSPANPTYLAREYFSSPATTALADEVLKRDWTQISGEASESALNALRWMQEQVDARSGGNLDRL